MERIALWVYPGEKDVMLISNEEVLDAMPVPHEFICHLVGDNDTGVWTLEISPMDKPRWYELIERYNHKFYICMPDGTGLTNQGKLH